MRKAWKKIEHWIAVAIMFYVFIMGPIKFIFAEELGLVRVSGGDVILDCPSDPKWPC